MNTATNSPVYSSGIQEINELFDNLHAPYGKGEIVRFNLVYQRIYPCLSQAEKKRAEKLVDELIENLQDVRLAPEIYGVV